LERLISLIWQGMKEETTSPAAINKPESMGRKLINLY